MGTGMHILTISIDAGENNESSLSGLHQEIKHLRQRVKRLESHMSEYDDALAELDQATTAIAGRVQNLVDEVNSLQGAQADSAKQAAAELQPYIDQLNSMATDPSQPVPPVTEPTGDGTGTDTSGGTGGPSAPSGTDGGVDTSTPDAGGTDGGEGGAPLGRRGRSW